MGVDDLLVNRGTAVCDTMSGGMGADKGTPTPLMVQGLQR